MKKAILILVLALSSVASGTAHADGFRVIVNAGNPMTSISSDALGAIFLKTRTAWTGGAKILPVDQRVTAHVREVMSHAVHGRSAAAVKNWWNQQIFAGKGVPPPELQNDAKVVAYVSANPGAIGYVELDAPIGDTKSITVTE